MDGNTYDDIFKSKKESDYYIALTEISEILKKLGERYIEKIPQEILNLIEQYKDKDSNFTFDITKKIADQNIHNETIEMLAYINYNYWLDKEDKIKFERILQNNFEKIESEKRKKYDPENIFKNKNNIEELKLQVVEESFWKKIIKKIGELIKNGYRRD